MNTESVVYKYEFPEGEMSLTVELKEGATVIHAAIQRDTPCIWVQTHTGGGPTEERTFIIRGTGERSPGPLNAYKHISSWMSSEGAFVLHFFEKTY